MQAGQLVEVVAPASGAAAPAPGKSYTAPWRHEVLLADILPLLRALAEHEVEYVLVGGVAVNLHGILRATEDIDLFVRPAPENVARLRAALHSVFNDDCIDEIAAEDLGGAYQTIRYGPPDADFVVDILGRLGDAFRYEDLEHELIEIEGVSVRIATPRTLFRMKRDTVRAIDRDDAERLALAFGLGEG